MVQMQTDLQSVKKVLKDIDTHDFRNLRDLVKTPAQLHSAKLQQMSDLRYKICDDLREVIGNECLNREAYCGILNRLVKQRAKEMGRMKKGYEQFYLEELTVNQKTLPA